MIPTITAFAASPDRGRGLARDMRVRWALEETGQAYDVRLLSFAEMKEPAHLALNPFGQIPTYEEGDLRLFESGAIVLHVAGRGPGLLPDDPVARARAVGWVFAAVSTVEPPMLDLEAAHFFERDNPGFAERVAAAEGRIGKRLAVLEARLAGRDWLEDGFTAGDLMMVSVLERLRRAAFFAAFPQLEAYVARAEARPAHRRAFAAQRAVFEASQRAV